MPIPDQSKLLSKVDDLLGNATDVLSEMISEVQDHFDGLSEDTQSSSDGKAIETYISCLQEALDATESARGELPDTSQEPTA